MAELYDLYAAGCKHVSTEMVAGTTQTDSATGMADYLIVTPVPATGALPASTIKLPQQAILYGIDGLNTNVAARYLYVFDYAPTVANPVPANATAPFPLGDLAHCLVMPGSGTSGGQFVYAANSGGGEGGFNKGLVLVVSTTAYPVLTIAADALYFLAVQFSTVYSGY